MDKIEELYNQWISLQPLKPEDQKRLDNKFKLEFNYNSNHLEGNTLTYGQTELLLMFDETSGNARLRDYEEMKAHNVGIEMVKQEAKDKERHLSETFIRELNKTILVRPYWKDAITEAGETTRIEIQIGEYKSRSNHVITATGEIFYYATPQETPAFMTELVKWYNQEIERKILSPIEIAALFHYRYIRIHPFEDGNGRIARLLVNYILIRNGYPMVVIQSEDKENYLRILHQCDVEVGLTPSDEVSATLDRIQPFVEYMKDQLAHSLRICVKAAKGESIEEEDDFAKQITLLERRTQMTKEKSVFSKEQVWNVLENFFFPMTEQIIKALKPSFRLFDQNRSWNKICKTESSNGGLHLNEVMKDTTNEQILDYVRNAKSLWFHHESKYPKREKLGVLSIEIDLGVLFEENSYTVTALKGIDFDYESYPTEKQCESIIAQYREMVKTKIERALGDKAE